MAIIYRTAGAWGAGKASKLTPAEVDGNFWDLLSRLVELESNPPAAVSVDHFEVIGGSLYVHMSDQSVLGPYQLPVARWTFRGAWQPATQYFDLDVLTYGGRVYQVLFDHVSGTEFDPGANDGQGHDYYGLLLSNPDPIADLAFYYGDRVRAAGVTMFQHSVARVLTLPAGLPESVAYLRVAPTTQDVSLLLYRNEVQIGSVDFPVSLGPDADGGMAGVFSFSSEAQLQPGDRFSIREASGVEDATAAGLSVTIVATVG